MEDLIVVGAGPAGVAAAVQCRRLGAVPCVLDASGRAGGLVEQARAVENYPGLGSPLPGPTLADRLGEDLDRWRIPVVRCSVTGIERSVGGFRLLRAEGAPLEARALVLAPGTAPVRLEIPGAQEGEGRVLFFAVRALLARHPRPERVLVVGSGEAAFDQAATLAEVGASVDVLVRGDRPRARGRLIDAAERTRAVRVRTGVRCEAIREEGGLVARLGAGAPPGREAPAAPRTPTVEERADCLLVAVGRRSAAAPLLVPMGIAPAGPVETGIPGLFVAGDGRTGRLGQVGMAVGDGLWAASLAIAFLEGR